MFAKILSETFKISDEIPDDEFTDKVNQTVESKNFTETYPHNSRIFSEIKMKEIYRALKKCSKESSTGTDQIHNLMLKNLPARSIQQLQKIFNKSVTEEVVPDGMKTSMVIMLPKKTDDTSSPLNYRPISLTSCLGKLFERIMCKRLYDFLNENHILIDEQSGFRRHRRTADNLYFLTQKVAESFNRGKKAICIFFDICKAFDRVWHNGLIYKLLEAKVPLWLVRWLQEFLAYRRFIVKVGSCLSEYKNIEAGVPQGSVISPLLFSLFINDIPIEKKPNCSQSTLFADDLASMFFFGKNGGLQARIQKYIDEIEKWLKKWKMKMAAKKCNYIIFAKNVAANPKLNLKLFGENIPMVDSTKFLGLVFDSKLSFNQQVDEIKVKCGERLNIIKILSNRKWNLSKNLLCNLYKSVIASVIDYSFVCINTLSESNINKIQAIQNKAIRFIYRAYEDPVSRIVRLSENHRLSSVVARWSELNESYIEVARANRNPLIVRLVEEFKGGFQSRFRRQEHLSEQLFL